MATPVTVSQQRYKQLLHTVGHEDRIISVGMSGLVELVEAGDFASPAIEECFSCLLQDYEGMENGCHCTRMHALFIFARKYKQLCEAPFKRKSGYTGRKTAARFRQLKRVLLEKDLLNNEQEKGYRGVFQLHGT